MPNPIDPLQEAGLGVPCRRDFEDTEPDFPSSGAVIPWLAGAGAVLFVALVAGWAVLG